MIDLSYAHGLVAHAELADPPADRYLTAYRGVEQVALAVISASPRAHRSRQDVWSLLARVAPEFGEWAGFFAAVGSRVRAVEAGARAVVSERDAADLVRDAQQFLAEASRWLRRRERVSEVS